jgi:TPP-dependent 2-oxoacid decarboxylase
MKETILANKNVTIHELEKLVFKNNSMEIRIGKWMTTITDSLPVSWEYNKNRYKAEKYKAQQIRLKEKRKTKISIDDTVATLAGLVVSAVGKLESETSPSTETQIEKKKKKKKTPLMQVSTNTSSVAKVSPLSCN